MIDREKVVEVLEKAKTVIEEWVPMFEQHNTPAGIDCAIDLLKEQEEKIEHLNNITLEYEKEVFRLQTLLKEQEYKTDISGQ